MANAVGKYVARYAEPEAAAHVRITARYDRALVVPACREDVSLLDGTYETARAARDKTLCILVINGRVDATPAVHAENERLLRAVRDRVPDLRPIAAEPPMWYVDRGAAGLLLVDRASEGFRLPPRQGVGLARKIGADVAVALHAAGRLGRFIYFTDADATLSPDHFDVEASVPKDAAILSFPFHHADGEDEQANLATAAYEVSLRYYVLGLAWAGSPYAVHTLGSALAISAAAYASVRGVPKRQAGEDFYLVNKAAKVGAVVAVQGPEVVLEARRSDRTPFGTGSAVQKLMQGELRLYDPRCFVGVKTVVSALSAFSEHRSYTRLSHELCHSPLPVGRALVSVLEDMGASRALSSLSSTYCTREALLSALHGWFDGFRTLKLVHALRSAHFPSVPWQHALTASEFCSIACQDIHAARRDLRECERAIAARRANDGNFRAGAATGESM